MEYSYVLIMASVEPEHVDSLLKPLFKVFILHLIGCDLLYIYRIQKVFITFILN